MAIFLISVGVLIFVGLYFHLRKQSEAIGRPDNGEDYYVEAGYRPADRELTLEELVDEIESRFPEWKIILERREKGQAGRTAE